MNPRKSAADLSPSTFNNYKRNRKLTFTALYADSVTSCQNPKLTDRAVRTWLLMQPILGMNVGYLGDVDTLAGKIWREPFQVNADIEKLVKFDLLRRDDEGTIFDPVMVNDLDGVVSHNSQKLTKVTFERCLDRQGSLSTNANPTLPQHSTVQSKVGPGPTLRLSTTGGTAVPQQTNSRLASGPEGPRHLSFGLTEADIEAAQLEFPQHDVEKLLSRFVEVNEKMDGGVKASKNPLKWLKGFLKTQKGSKAASNQTASSASTTTAPTASTVPAVPRVLPKLTVKYSKDDDNMEDPRWKIGGKSFYDNEHIDEMRDMPLQSRESAHEWLSKLVGFEWDTEAAIDDEFALFEAYDKDNMVQGINRCYIIEEESEKVKDIVERIEGPIPQEPEPLEQIVIESEPVLEPLPPITLPPSPQHGDSREDGKVYSDRYASWFPKDRWENLERVK